MTFLGICLSASLSAQVEIRAHVNGLPGNDISGTTLYMNANPDEYFSKTFNILNTSGSVGSFNIERMRIVEPTNWIDGLCWAPNPDSNSGGMCFTGAQMSTNPWTTPNTINFPVNGEGSLLIEFYTSGTGCGHYRYYVVDGVTRLDSVDLEVCTILGQNDFEINSLNLYPNPVENLLHIETACSEEMQVMIVDFRGKVVLIETLNESGTINVSDLMKGIYFVTVIQSGNKLPCQKIVITK